MMQIPVGRCFFLAALALVSIRCNNHVRGFSPRRQTQQYYHHSTTRHPRKYASNHVVDGAILRVAATNKPNNILYCSLSPRSVQSEHLPRKKKFGSWSRNPETLTITDQHRKVSSSWKEKKGKPRIGVVLAVICATIFLAGGTQPAFAGTIEAADIASSSLPIVNLTPMLTRLQEVRLTGRLLYAAVLGAAVGKERSTANHHPAGVRTLALVSLGSAAFTLCSIYGFGVTGKFDTSRMASAVASGKFCFAKPVDYSLVHLMSLTHMASSTGIGFIGAGVITTSSTRNQSVVHGLTTAAAVWVSAAVGVTCGTGLYILATSLAMATLGFLRIGGNVKHKRGPHRRSDESIVRTMSESDPELLQKLIHWETTNLQEIGKRDQDPSTNTQQMGEFRMEDKDDECLISQRYFPDGKGEKPCRRDKVVEDDKNDNHNDDYFYDDDDDEVIVMTTGREYRNETEDISPHNRYSRPGHHDDDIAP